MVEECNHPIRIGGMCGCCGADIEEKSEELFTLLHSNTSVLLNKKEAERVNEEMYLGTVQNKKLVLLLDLDQTVIHTSASMRFGTYFEEFKKYSSKEQKRAQNPQRESTVPEDSRTDSMAAGASELDSSPEGINKNKPKESDPEDKHKDRESVPEDKHRKIEPSTDERRKKRKFSFDEYKNEYLKEIDSQLKDIREIKIDGYTYYVKLRDRLEWFLKEAEKYCEMHIYTMGNKAYATAIVKILDPTGKLFGSRIITRDDNFGCFDKDIKRLFPTNSKHVIILDDRPDVWGFVDNLYPIKPYYFFETDDINSPEALQNGYLPDVGMPVSIPNNKEDLLEEISIECIRNPFDNELEKVLRGLVEVHAEFFAGTYSIAHILREKKNIFLGCTAKIVGQKEYVEYLRRLFKHHGGRVLRKSSNSPYTHWIQADTKRVYLKSKRLENVKYVDAEWVYASVYAFNRNPEGMYIVQERICDEAESNIESDDSKDPSNDSLYSSDESLYKKILDDA
ncbi:RNA polymerase II subunit A C-terminal domain phosphatase [Nematocida ausubeli]|nr:RNA polymerase II subunit A C-terminal domain phosphatase [Nematocida ausubeli]